MEVLFFRKRAERGNPSELPREINFYVQANFGEPRTAYRMLRSAGQPRHGAFGRHAERSI
jgi:hypothetical protein